jgi:hypothetical protein
LNYSRFDNSCQSWHFVAHYTMCGRVYKFTILILSDVTVPLALQKMLGAELRRGPSGVVVSKFGKK